MRRDDLPLLAGWLAQPHVREWWHDEPTELPGVEAAYGPCIDGDDPTEPFVIVADEHPVGMIQRYLLADEPAWAAALAGIADVTDAAGIDYLIGELNSPDPSDAGPEYAYVLTRH